MLRARDRAVASRRPADRSESHGYVALYEVWRVARRRRVPRAPRSLTRGQERIKRPSLKKARTATVDSTPDYVWQQARMLAVARAMQPLSACACAWAVQLFHDADGAAAFAAADHEDRSRARRRVAEMVRRAAGSAELTRRTAARACAQLERDVLPPIREREEVRSCSLTPRMRGRVLHTTFLKRDAAKGSAEPRARPPGPQRGKHTRRR